MINNSRAFFDFSQVWYRGLSRDTPYTTIVQGNGVKAQGHSATSGGLQVAMHSQLPRFLVDFALVYAPLMHKPLITSAYVFPQPLKK